VIISCEKRERMGRLAFLEGQSDSPLLRARISFYEHGYEGVESKLKKMMNLVTKQTELIMGQELSGLALDFRSGKEPHSFLLSSFLSFLSSFLLSFFFSFSFSFLFFFFFFILFFIFFIFFNKSKSYIKKFF